MLGKFASRHSRLAPIYAPRPLARARRAPELGRRALGRRLHGRARERAWDRLRLRALATLFGGRLGLVRLRFVGEDARLVLAREQPLELILVDRLPLDQEAGDAVQLVHVRLERRDGQLVRLFNYPADLVVDLARDLLGVVGLVA